MEHILVNKICAHLKRQKKKYISDDGTYNSEQNLCLSKKTKKRSIFLMMEHLIVKKFVPI